MNTIKATPELVLDLNGPLPKGRQWHPTKDGASYTNEHTDNCSCSVECILILDKDNGGYWIPYAWRWGTLLAPWEIQDDEPLRKLIHHHIERLENNE